MTAPADSRAHPRGVYLGLKGGTRELIAVSGGQEHAAAISRGTHPNFSRYGNPSEPSFIAIDQVADLETDAGSPVVTRRLARIAGYLLIAMPAVDAGARAVGVAELGAVARECGDVISRLGAALADDGVVGAKEGRDLQAEILEAMEVLAALDAAIRHQETGMPGSRPGRDQKGRGS